MKNQRYILTSGLLLASLVFFGGCSKEDSINSSERYLNFGVNTVDMSITKSVAAEATESAASVTLKTQGGNVYLPMTVTEEPNCDFAAVGTKAESISEITSFYAKGFDEETENQWFPASGDPELVTTGKQYSGYKWVDGSSYLFYAYSDLPDYASAIIDELDMTLTISSIPSDAEAQQDILLGVYGGTGEGEGKAAMNFYHPLSAVIFKLGSTSGTMSITGISINGVKKGGTTVWSDAADSEGLLEFDWRDATGSIKVEQQILSPGTDDQLGVPFMLIPQTFTSENPATITVTATVDGVAKEFTASLASGEWVSGMKYTYTLNFASGPDPDFWVDLGLKSVEGYPLLISKYNVESIDNDGTVHFCEDETELGLYDNIENYNTLQLKTEDGTACRFFTSSEIFNFVYDEMDIREVFTAYIGVTCSHPKDSFYYEFKPNGEIEKGEFKNSLKFPHPTNDYINVLQGYNMAPGHFSANFSLILGVDYYNTKDYYDISSNGAYSETTFKVVSENRESQSPCHISDVRIFDNTSSGSHVKNEYGTGFIFSKNDYALYSNIMGVRKYEEFMLVIEYSDNKGNSHWGYYDTIPDSYDIEFNDGNGDYSYDFDARTTRITYVGPDISGRSSNAATLTLIHNSKNPDLNLTIHYTYDASTCITSGTLITLADGSQKPIEEITYNDIVKVWNFDKGCYDSVPVLWVSRSGFSSNSYYKLTLSNGNILKFVNNHRVFNVTTGRFERVLDVAPESEIYTEDGVATIKSIDLVNEEVEFYNLATEYHMNYFANDLLSSCDFNNLYTINSSTMMFEKDGRKRHPYKEFKNAGISREFYNGFRLGEQTMPIDSIKYKIDNCVMPEMLEKPAPSLWQRFKTWFKSVFGCNS